jgi:RNA-directed DNA polymerase
VRKAARKDKRTRFTALLHPVTVGLLWDSYFALKRDAAPGVDGLTRKEYETGLDEKLVDLHSRIHRGTYRARPSKRAYIPKADGRQRPLGIAALEDKIVQQAVVTVLNQIYQEDFLLWQQTAQRSSTHWAVNQRPAGEGHRSGRRLDATSWTTARV